LQVGRRFGVRGRPPQFGSVRPILPTFCRQMNPRRPSSGSPQTGLHPRRQHGRETKDEPTRSVASDRVCVDGSNELVAWFHVPGIVLAALRSPRRLCPGRDPPGRRRRPRPADGQRCLLSFAGPSGPKPLRRSGSTSTCCWRSTASRPSTGSSCAPRTREWSPDRHRPASARAPTVDPAQRSVVPDRIARGGCEAPGRATSSAESAGSRAPGRCVGRSQRSAHER
jgi:hypothetical protein